MPGSLPDPLPDPLSITRPARAWLVLLPVFLPLAGCTTVGAPSFEIFGAFFPAWMLCATIGIIAGFAARAAFVTTRLTAVLPYQLLVCTAVGAIFAICFWLFLFER